jgi:hypothetical protein
VTRPTPAHLPTKHHVQDNAHKSTKSPYDALPYSTPNPANSTSGPKIGTSPVCWLIDAYCASVSACTSNDACVGSPCATLVHAIGTRNLENLAPAIRAACSLESSPSRPSTMNSEGELGKGRSSPFARTPGMIPLSESSGLRLKSRRVRNYP